MSKRIPTKQDEREKINVRERLTDNVLDLSLMNISVVPVAEIKPLKRATVLDLSNNVITAINTEFTTLVQLTKLDLSNNKIRLITDDFGNLVNLRHLDLYNNQIERLPLSFGRLKKLKYLDLKNNRLNPVFSKIVGTCTDQKDCIEAARKAVTFMVDIEQQVLEERRKEKEQKELELQREQGKALQEAKQSDKANPDKKKKNKNKKSKVDSSQPVNNQMDDVATNNKVTQKEIKGICNTENDRKTSGMGIVRYFLLAALVVIVLTIVFMFKAELIDEIFGRGSIEILEEYIK
ncbi:leucine-rich repeat-containing protein 59 [Ochlerotatus camptorhynchus]|uniref:leucine-rich repeat-containing protein 59 n=1 Tax=Ochlerotatus camptorhynchus TaxID=644619 RepID=UPI0031D074DB